MSPWDRKGWYGSGPKKPPPAHGIKLKKAGTTWWGQRWIEALEHVLRGDSGRLARGRTYARAGRAHDLVIRDGKVTAKVTGSRATPYKIEIALQQLDGAAWQRAITSMAEKAQFSAELLGGHMPEAIDEAFRATGTSIFPQQRAELHTRCSCPDWGDPCKHVAAVYYLIGEALDSDPFLLFELRGRTKEAVLLALRAARGEPAEAARAARSTANAAGPGSGEVAPELPSVTLDAVQPADYDKAREALPSLQFVFDAPVAHGAVLRQLGTPAAWAGSESPADVLSPLLRAAAESARRIALTEPLVPDVDDDSQLRAAVSAPGIADVALTTPRGKPAGRRARGAGADALQPQAASAAAARRRGQPKAARKRSARRRDE